MARPRSARTGVVGLVGLALLAAGCSSTPRDTAPTPTSSAASPTSSPPSTAPTAPSSSATVRVVQHVVATGLDVPWDIAVLPDGSALVSLRDQARIVRVTAAGRVSRVPATGPDGRVPGVVPAGEGGLLGLALSPGFGTDHVVYAYFTATRDNRIVRMTYSGGRLSAPSVVFSGIPKGSNHDGGRIAFGPDGMLYVGTGEGGQPDRAQNRSSLGGKILRLTPTGQVPAGNPFPGSPVWTYGHRNVQGLAWDSRGTMYASEFGQNTWDELNLIVKGHNYGWPLVEGYGHRSGYTDPLRVWPTDQASPSGICIVDDVVFMAALRGERLWRIPLTSRGTRAPHALFVGTFGRLRAVVPAPDGGLWLLTNNTARGTPRAGDDKLVEIPRPH
jgi:glucose/arabinose dehydrogenase